MKWLARHGGRGEKAGTRRGGGQWRRWRRIVIVITYEARESEGDNISLAIEPREELSLGLAGETWVPELEMA